MPPSVKTPEWFYEVMAGAALDATGLSDLLEGVALSERNLEAIQDALREADAKSENARHRALAEEAEPQKPPSTAPGTTSGRAVRDQVTHSEPRAVEWCGLASSAMRTKSSTGRWFAPNGDRWWRVWAWP